MKRLTLLIHMLFALGVLNAQQVAKNVLVEHFTNTRCSVCASRNPGFLNNLQNQSGVLHVAYYPSSPYPTCLLNQQNKTENDDRTKWYGIFGATPRLVIQGKVVDGFADYAADELFAPFRSQTTFISCNAVIQEFDDSLEVELLIYKTDTSGITQLNLTVLVVEQLLNYDAPNGEDKHLNVFRKSLTSVTGEFIELERQGDYLRWVRRVKKENHWNIPQMYAMGIFQQSDKTVVQAARSQPLGGTTGLNSNTLGELDNISIFPNPTASFIRFEGLATTAVNLDLYNTLGEKVWSYHGTSSDIVNLPQLSNGQYWLHIHNSTASVKRQIHIQHF